MAWKSTVIITIGRELRAVERSPDTAMRELTELTKKKKEMLFPLRPFVETREKKGKQGHLELSSRYAYSKKNTLLSNANPMNKHSSVVSQVLCFLLSLSGLAVMTTRLSVHYELWVKKKRGKSLKIKKRTKRSTSSVTTWCLRHTMPTQTYKHTYTHV